MDWLIRLLSALPIAIIVIGVFGNLSAFCIFRFSNDMQQISSMVYLSFAALTDTVSLFGFNLNNFLRTYFGFTTTALNTPTCRLVMFLQFASLESSGLLFSMVSIDRFFSIVALPGSFSSKLPFSSVRSAFIWSIGIVAFICLLNSHLLFLAGVHAPSRSLKFNATSQSVFRCYESWTGSDIYPKWNIVNMTLYNLLPFSLMIIFNALLIRYGLFSGANRKMATRKSSARKRELRITLLLVTFMYILMVLPGGIFFGFFSASLSSQWGSLLGLAFDSLSFLNRSTLFFACLITNMKFRQIVVQNVKRAMYFCCFARRKASNENRPRERSKCEINSIAFSNINAK